MTNSASLPSFLKLSSAPENSDWSWSWHYILCIFLVYQAGNILWKYWWKAPSNVIIAAYPTPFGRWLTALHMVFDSETLLQRAYDMYKGKTFAIPLTDRWIVFISDSEQLKVLDRERKSVLSIDKALDQLGSIGPILGHYQISAAQMEYKDEAGRVMNGVMKNKLRLHLPSMSSSFHACIRKTMALEMDHPLYNNCEQRNWKSVQLLPALIRIFTRVNLLAFVGEEQADHPEVYQNLLNFLGAAGRAFAIFNIIPDIFIPIIAPIAMGFGITRAKVYNLILGLTSKALGGGYSTKEKHHQQRQENLSQWVADMTKVQNTARVARITLGLLFASAFQIPTVIQFCIYRLCKHPEYFQKLRAEALEHKNLCFSSMNCDMPYLDSFIKETCRLTPGAIFSNPRAVITPYTLGDGCHIPSGNWIAIPQLPLMCDEDIWLRAKEFNGFRFVHGKDIPEARFTYPSDKFPFWGSPKHACPARFYASVIIKIVLSQLLLEYEFKLKDETTWLYIPFGKVRVPNPFMTLLVRKRL